MNIIRIYNKDKAKLAQISISQVIRVTEIRQMVGVETVQIEAALSSIVAGYFETDGWIVDEEDRPFIIRYIYQSEADQLVKVVAYSPHFGLTKRITRPNQGDPILTATGTADKIVKTFIRDTAPDDDEYRGLGIVCAPDRIDGPTITEQTRRHILGDRIAAILAAAGRREVWSWNGGNITFDTLPVTDRTAGNPEGNSVCIFAGRFGNIENETLEIDTTAKQNTVYVGGAGEGDEREVYAHGTDRKGWERCEVFVDARDVEAGDTATMEQRALQAMMDAAVTVKATAKDNTNLVFGRDYDIGDLVTVQVAYKTYEPDGPYFKTVRRYIGLKQQIAQALITYNADVRTVDVTFGLTVEQQQQATGGMGSRVSNLEAAGQGGASIDPAKFVKKEGDVMTGGLSLPVLDIDRPGTPSGSAEHDKSLWFKSGGKTRWRLASNSTDESGDNAGSNFDISRYDDDGNLINTPFSISRATGDITITGPITTPNNAVGINIGDDARLADRNIANTMFLEGQHNTNRGYINFGQTYGNHLGAVNGGNLTWRGNQVWDAAGLPYETGTWTPTLYGATTAGSPTYGSRSGSFQRIGKMCIITGALSISAKGGMAGELRIGGIPFTHAPGYASGLAVGAAGGYSINKMSLHIDGNTNYASLRANITAITAADIPDSFALWGFSGVYHIK